MPGLATGGLQIRGRLAGMRSAGSFRIALRCAMVVEPIGGYSMFCPNCGRDNAKERKFCASCGTNLEAISQVLSGSRDDFFTKTDTALDQFIARYAEHVFKNAPSNATERKVGNSWQILGQAVLTSFVDMLLFSLMWNILPLRFLILLISTPFRLLSSRNRQKAATGGLEQPPPLALQEPPPRQWLPESPPSISEHTTDILEKEVRRRTDQNSESGQTN